MFAERLRELRRIHDLTQLELAEKLGVAKSTIAGYEKGFRKPKMETLNQIADILNTSSDYLIGLTNDKTAKEHSKDLEKLLKEPDFTYKGKKLSNEDMDFLISYLERISKLEPNNNNNNNNNDINNSSNDKKNNNNNDNDVEFSTMN